LVRVAFSSLNYKDALAATGQPGVVRTFPHVPGIDAAGVVAESSSANVQIGKNVIVTGHGLGAERWGGWAEYIRVPADWVVPLPNGLTLEESMIYGTAGFTAALCIRSLQEHGVEPSCGDVVVTGATGGVGSVAVAILARLGYTVVAVTGKTERHAWLKDRGAGRVVGREDVLDTGSKPLLSANWAGAVDSVGGQMLASILRATKQNGCVAACGLVGGAELSLTVFPFILRGVTLAGIDSAWCPLARRVDIWQRLAGAWRPDRIAELATTVPLEQLDAHVDAMLAGNSIGRTVVAI
jgi:putative YhdH/YhfP family quinone oxidoreductase